VLRETDADQVTLIGAGVTLHECLAAAVLDALTGAGRADLAVAHLAVREMPGSGTPAELLDAAGISASHIADAARGLLA
jgi:transketolase